MPSVLLANLFAGIHWPSITGSLALLSIALTVATMFWILAIKREPTSALAWCLFVLFVPFLGCFLFLLFGYQSVQAPIRKKRRHAAGFRPRGTGADGRSDNPGYEGLAGLAVRLGAQPATIGNAVIVLDKGESTYDAMIHAIREAKHHIHLQLFIVRSDESGIRFMEALAERARAGVEVRFLYDAVGSWGLKSRVLRILTSCNGQALPFRTMSNALRRRLQINLRNHRKLLIVDGRIGFTGGFNLGDEYLGKNPFYGPWRDTFIRVEGPAVADLQRVFTEDWDFSADEDLTTDAYFPVVPPMGPSTVQVAWSGPDQDIKMIREVYFAAIMRSRKRIWLASPYFVPDSGMLDALCLAAHLGRDVRVLCPFRPDKWLPLLAARYYWAELLRAGGKVYQYTNGFMHAKTLLIDDEWASVGSANFDNRSLHLNFEVTCLIESSDVQTKLERQFLRDLEVSIRLDTEVFARRPYISKMAENASRLLSPIL